MNSTASQQDDLNRGELLDKLKALITQTPNPPKENDHEQGLVMCINGGFGTGKTWTLLELKKQLEADGNPVAYLSAWESDHAGDAMVAIISQLDELILKETKHWLEKNKQNSVLDKLKESSGRVARAVLKSLPAALEKIPGGKLLSETINNYLDVADSAKEPQKYDAIEQFELRSKSLTQSKAALTTLASNEFFASDGKRLVILIDELDRCRPTYAIEMLEAIKHWFCVPNVVFVLAMDREQLSHSIRAVYGQGFDVDGYFLRFFHLVENLKINLEQINSFFEHIEKPYASNETYKGLPKGTIRLNRVETRSIYSYQQFLQNIPESKLPTLRECERVFLEYQRILSMSVEKQYYGSNTTYTLLILDGVYFTQELGQVVCQLDSTNGDNLDYLLQTGAICLYENGIPSDGLYAVFLYCLIRTQRFEILNQSDIREFFHDLFMEAGIKDGSKTINSLIDDFLKDTKNRINHEIQNFLVTLKSLIGQCGLNFVEMAQEKQHPAYREHIFFLRMVRDLCLLVQRRI
jgi:hypothetical protein